MEKIKLKARAKVNLTLDVMGRRENGYHDLQMIMQSISLSDEIQIRKSNISGIQLETNLNWLPKDEKNIAYRGAKLMMETYGIKQGVSITLWKRIPVGAGLAGGSTDCAAVIEGMNWLFDLGLDEKEQMALGRKLGMDIPFCILGGTALAEGLGDELTSLPSCPPFYLVLAKPPVSVSTARVYQRFDFQKVNKRPNTMEMIQAVKEGDLEKISSGLCNVLESVTIEQYPVLDEIKKSMISLGAKGAVMSGSGPTVYGIFSTQETAGKAADTLREIYHYREIYLAHTVEKERERKKNYG